MNDTVRALGYVGFEPSGFSLRAPEKARERTRKIDSLATRFAMASWTSLRKQADQASGKMSLSHTPGRK